MPLFKPADILGFSGASLVSDVINCCTYGIPRWSILPRRNRGGGTGWPAFTVGSNDS